MTENVNVQHIGFEAKALVREYSFLVRQALNETSEFTLTILNEAFNSRRVRYQDGPEICSLKLHHELATFSNHPRKHITVSAKSSWTSTATPTPRNPSPAPKPTGRTNSLEVARSISFLQA